jgi:hypothetical protein
MFCEPELPVLWEYLQKYFVIFIGYLTSCLRGLPLQTAIFRYGLCIGCNGGLGNLDSRLFGGDQGVLRCWLEISGIKVYYASSKVSTSRRHGW